MLFVLDNDIDAAVCTMLSAARHKCIHVGKVGLGRATDDEVSVFADNHNAAFVTHDKELIRRRRRNTFGHHIHLDCREWEAVAVLKAHLATVMELVESRDATVVRVSVDGAILYPTRWA